MVDLSSEIIRTLITTIITTLGGIIGAYLIRRRVEKPKSSSVGIGAVIGIVIGILVGVTLAVIWPTGDPCLRAKIAAPTGIKDRAHAAAYKIEHEVPVSWTPPNGQRCVMTVQTYQKDNPVPREYKNVVSGTKLDLGDPGSGETEIKIWVEGYATPVDNIWVWIK